MASCYEVASMVIKETTSELGSGFHVNDIRKQVFKNVCSKIDDFMDECEAIAFEVGPDDKNDLDICIKVNSLNYEVNDINHPIFDIIEQMKDFSFKPYTVDYVQTKFIFSGIWDNARTEMDCE